MTGLYSFALSAIYGITLFTLSDYTDVAFLDAIVDTKSATATVYPWQIRQDFYVLQIHSINEALFLKVHLRRISVDVSWLDKSE